MRKTHGFTMVEVIIVVAIIAILASIIMPKMTGSRQKATLEACKANLKHIAVAINLYMNDNAGRVPANSTIDASNILVTQNYLKSAPSCPGRGSGSCYEIGGTYPGTYICCKNTSNAWHPSLSTSRPLLYLRGGYVY